jgi:hypothetical protein
MINFVQATDHYVHMHAKFGDLTFYGFLQFITPRFYLLQFLQCNNVQIEFGQAYCRDMLKIIPVKFSFDFLTFI